VLAVAERRAAPLRGEASEVRAHGGDQVVHGRAG
jgi:hypothetical protein